MDKTSEQRFDELEVMFRECLFDCILDRARGGANRLMKSLDNIHTGNMSPNFYLWHARAKQLLYKLCLPENRSYWRTALPYERSTAEYHNWRIDCLNRDNWQCQGDSDKHVKELNVHHIKPYKDHVSLRIDVDNGITLCEKCHKTSHKRLK